MQLIAFERIISHSVRSILAVAARTTTILLLFSCHSSTSFTEKEKQETAAGARQVLHDYYNDISKSGLMAEFAYLDSSDEYFWVPPGYNVPLTYDSVARILRKMAGMYRSTYVQWDSLRVIPLSKQYATYTGQLSSIMTDTTGHADSFRLIETGVLIKRSSGWKLLHGQTAIVTE